MTIAIYIHIISFSPFLIIAIDHSQITANNLIYGTKGHTVICRRPASHG